MTAPAAGPPRAAPPARLCAEPGCGDWGTHGYGWDPLKDPPIEGNWWCAAHDPHARARAAEKAAAPPPERVEGPRPAPELRDIPEGPEIQPSAQGRLL